MHCRLLSSISELHPLDASNNSPPPPQAVTTKSISRHCQASPSPHAFQGLIRTAPQERPLLHPCGACVLVCTSAL